MTEKVPIDPALFVADFHRMFAVATRGGVAWHNDPADWKAPRAPYEIWEQRSPQPVEPGVSQQVTYEVWPLADPHNRRVERAVPDRHGRPEIRRGNPPQYPGCVVRLTPWHTVETFGRRAPDGDTLVTVTDTLVHHLNQHDVPWIETTPLNRCVGQLVARSLLLGSGPEGVYGPAEGRMGPFVRALANLEFSRSRKVLRRHVSLYLGRVLRRELSGGDTRGTMRRAIETTPGGFAARAAAQMERAGYIPPEFWWKNGVEGSLVFDKEAGPTMLRRLEANLIEHGEAVLAEVPATNLLPTLRRYISKLLITYSMDENRDRGKLQKIFLALATQRSRTMGRGVHDLSINLRTLIALSNDLAQGINRNLQDRGVTGPGLLLPQLGYDSLWNVPPALLRVLYATVSPNADPAVMADMFERDSMHVSVVEAICQKLREKSVEPNPGDARLRYPHAVAGDLPELLSGMRSPDSYRRLRPWYRRRQRAARTASGYGLFGPGGAVS